MNVNDKFFNNNPNLIKNKQDLISLNFNDYNISNISLTFKLNNIEFLSLKNNSLINLKFLEYFPNLFYLDISNNPIEKFNILNVYNTYGYLSLSSPTKYLEKNFLSIKDLNVGILFIKINDKNIENNFLLNNPNILMYNNTLFSFEDKFNFNVLNKKKFIFNNNDFINIHKKNNSNLNSVSTSFLSSALNSPNKKMKINYNNNDENNKIKKNFHLITNKKSLELINFFEEFNNIMNNLFKNKEKNNFLNYNNKQLNLSYEYKKIYFISQINHYIQNLIVEKKNFYFSPNNIKIFTININIFKFINIELQIFLLSLIYLYIFGLISFNLIFQILSHFYYKNISVLKINKDFEYIKNEIKNLLNIKTLYLIIEYTDLYKHLKTLDIQNKEFLNKIISSLSILKLSNNIMKIIENNKININVYLFKNNILEKKYFIKDKIIKFLHEIKIIKETICIINYVIDYMLNKEYDKIIFEKFSNEYQIFLEIKNHLINYYSSKENKNESISDILYNDFQIKHLRNKYFFKNNKIKKYKQNTCNVLLNHKKMLLSNKKKYNNNSSNFHSLDKYEIQIIKDNKKIEKDLLKNIKILKDKKNFFITNKKIGSDDNKKNNSFNNNINNNKETMDNTSELLFYKQNYLKINKFNSVNKNKVYINNYNKNLCNLSDNFSKSMSNIKNNHRPKFPFFEQYENNFKILNKKDNIKNKKFSIDCYNKNISNSFSINNNKSFNNINDYVNNNNNFIINKHLKCKINIKNMILMKNHNFNNNNKNKIYFLQKNNKNNKNNKNVLDSYINSLLSKSNSLINSNE